jgi:hypothetical protein
MDKQTGMLCLLQNACKVTSVPRVIGSEGFCYLLEKSARIFSLFSFPPQWDKLYVIWGRNRSLKTFIPAHTHYVPCTCIIRITFPGSYSVENITDYCYYRIPYAVRSIRLSTHAFKKLFRYNFYVRILYAVLFHFNITSIYLTTITGIIISSS